MAKKTKSSKKRRQRRPNIPSYTTPIEQSTPAEVGAALANGASHIAAAPLASSDATTESIDWAAEYPFFAPDMKRLGIVVLFMVVLLLAMNLVFIYLLP